MWFGKPQLTHGQEAYQLFSGYPAIWNASATCRSVCPMSSDGLRNVAPGLDTVGSLGKRPNLWHLGQRVIASELCPIVSPFTCGG
jgi:hypothetical protein